MVFSKILNYIGTLLEWDSDSSEYTDNNTNILTGDVKSSLASISLGVNPGSDEGFQYEYFSNVTYSDALIFTRALTSSEISSDYNGEVKPTNKDNLLLYYDFKR